MSHLHSRRVFVRSQNLVERARDGVGKKVSASSVDLKRIKWWIDTYFGKNKSQLSKYLRALGVDPKVFPYLLPIEGRSNTYIHLRAKKRKSDASQKAPSYETSSVGRLCSNYIESAMQTFSACLNRSLKNGLAVDRQRIISDFRQYLYIRISALIVPSLILEANIHRINLPTQNLPEERFKLFSDSFLIQKNRENFWNKYGLLRHAFPDEVPNILALDI